MESAACLWSHPPSSLCLRSCSSVFCQDKSVQKHHLCWLTERWSVHSHSSWQCWQSQLLGSPLWVGPTWPRRACSPISVSFGELCVVLASTHVLSGLLEEEECKNAIVSLSGKHFTRDLFQMLL